MTPLIDETERRAALDTTCSHHVESPAGSGKTLLLTMRFLKLLGEVDDPREIVALTFTEKATGEMHDRIVRYLDRAGRSEPPDNDLDEKLLSLAAQALKKQGQQTSLITAADGLHIMTFHGFCSYIARRAPLEAGLAPGYDIIESEGQTEIIEEAVETACNGILSRSSDDMTRVSLEHRLLRHNNNWSSLSVELQDIIRGRDRFADLTRFVRDTAQGGLSTLSDVIRDRLRVYIEARLAHLHSGLLASELGDRWDALVTHLSSQGADAALSLPPTLPGGNWEELPHWQCMADVLLTQGGTPRKSMGPKTGFYAGFSTTEWGKCIAGLPHDTGSILHDTRELPSVDEPDTLIDELSHFIIVAAAVTGAYEDLCRRRHVVDFIDLEQSALRVLDGDHPSDLHLYLDARIRHLLIDEFQDTNGNQWELLQRLCSGWTGDDGRTVFIVGDPKQSIYAFRNAEVRLFMEAREGIPLAGHGLLPLTSHRLKTNFRSTGALIAWTNDLFATTVMTDPDYDADEVDFSPSVPIDQTDQTDQTNQIDQTDQTDQTHQPTLTLFHDDNRDSARDREAQWLVRTAKKLWMETGVSQSIAILLFTRNRLQRYLRACRDEGLPLQVEEGLVLKDRPEVIHLLQAARAFVNPHDDLACASLLRSPWSWFDTETLHETALQEADGWMDKIRLAAASTPALERLVAACDGASQRLGRDPLGSVIQRFWEDLDGPRRTASLYGMAGVANCLTLFRLLADAERGIPLETLETLERVIDTVYEPPDPRASLSPVHLMTIHRAKGLEFDTVFIPFMDWRPLASGSRTPPPYLLERIPGTGGRYVMAMGHDYRTGEAPKTYRLLRTLQRNRRWGEAKRWFYVAATRARSRLIMSGIATVKDDDITAPTGSMLGLVMRHEGIERLPAEGRHIGVSVNPAMPAVPPLEDRGDIMIAEPYSLTPERLPYGIETPSSLDKDRIYDGIAAANGDELSGDPSMDAIGGTVTHDIITTALTGRPLPPVTAIVTALAERGITVDQARALAPDLLAASTATVQSPFITTLTGGSHHVVQTEVAVEDIRADGHLRSGVIDFLVFDGSSWWVCDFKTARPGDLEGEEDFIARERAAYRSQLNAYAAMVAHAEGVDVTEVRRGIYLTALQEWVEYDCNA